jgi:hypothetical protein
MPIDGLDRMRRAWILLVLAAACTEHGSGGGPGPGPGNDGGSGRACGGFNPQPCAADELCDFPRNSCGAADEGGTCVKRPTGCPDIFQPTCGCDGQMHDNACEAAAVGADVNANGTCAVEAGKFACGFLQCDLMTQYCEHAFSDVGSEPDSFACKALPACPSQFPTCSCLVNEPCGAMCAGSGTTGLTLSCPGG